MKNKAKEIRQILKKEFPSIKFRVRSNIYSVNITYIDGITVEQVEDHVMRFEKIFRDEKTGEILSGGNSYVFVKREYSKESKDKVHNQVDNILNNMNFHLSDLEKSEIRSFALKTTDFSHPIKFKSRTAALSQSIAGNTLCN